MAYDPTARAFATETEPVDAKPIMEATRKFTVVGVGASAGGLDAFTRFLGAVPAGCDMAFILVQHLAPASENLMVGLLAKHTSMKVRQAADGMMVEPGGCYVIPPATYLTVAGGLFQISPSPAGQGARLPFDTLLLSLAEAYAEHAAAVILSGTGADGTAGLQAIAAQGGVVLAQSPEEAGYDGMPRSAIATGVVDMVLPAADIPAALLRFGQIVAAPEAALRPAGEKRDWLADIIELLRTRTVHDFSLYKIGTMARRIGRRMALSAIAPDGMEAYLELLKRDPGEIDELAASLLINVTRFFRDLDVFDFLAEKVLRDMIRDHPADRPLRIWSAGCSTGEEAYSLAMLCIEMIAAAERNIKLQVFASDVDPDAIMRAREGYYPLDIAADVSPARLKRFFVRDERGYRVAPELRGTVVFTVQNVLADPPFSRLDIVSCRNLLIYLQPEAQAKVIMLFHFALREGGVLMLGNSETIGAVEGRFAVIGKTERIYRHIGRNRPGLLGVLATVGEGMRQSGPQLRPQVPVRQAGLADLSRRIVLENFAPAAVMVNEKLECLYMLGQTDRYLRLAPGHPTHDLLSMARPGMRTRLRTGLTEAIERQRRIVMRGGRTLHRGKSVNFDIDIQPVVAADEPLLLVCFVDQPASHGNEGTAPPPPRTAELERELETTRTELQGAIRDLEVSTEEQKVINEEALSVSEEYQSTNEELVTSKEELQSLNEELTALNSQLQETLERQRTTADDLQNVLYSTDVATLFLDAKLNIRFFTPATRSLFNLIAGDIGRPLADLRNLAADAELAEDVRLVLGNAAPIEREIEKHGDDADSGSWFVRRILPYRAHSGGIEGVVITFNDITERKKDKAALIEAIQKAEHASLAKSRFLSAASHDLRQPLQTLTLLHGMLAKMAAKGEIGARMPGLLGRFEETLGSMTGMLNTLLDINQIEAGVVKADIVDFGIDGVLNHLRQSFGLQAEAGGLSLRVVGCGLIVRSDPVLLEQMLRNLMANAVKYTAHGKILLGCRRRGAMLRIQVIDTGLGIPIDQLKLIFEEYHRVENAATERSKGLGLGLSIVQRLGVLLGHEVQVRSMPSKGSAFSVDVPLADVATAGAAAPPGPAGEVAAARVAEAGRHRSGTIVVIEDDVELADLLTSFLGGEGHRVTVAQSGAAALDLLARGAIRPDLILTDFNLHAGLDGLHLAQRLRDLFGEALPVIVLTGDISPQTLQDVSAQGCKQLSKPVRLEELTEAIQALLPDSCASGPHGSTGDDADADASVIFIVDADAVARDEICALLAHDGRKTRAFASSAAFLAEFRPAAGQCVLIDGYLPGLDGLDVLRQLRAAGRSVPVVMMKRGSDVRMAVQAMQAGAADFVEKPFTGAALLACLQRAIDESEDSSKVTAGRDKAIAQLATLTVRQREIMRLVLDGHPSKNIAADLNISQRTVENHRAAIMHKTGSGSLPALARMALAAASEIVAK
jgi:two-component system CheB/CheR fusion protein